MNLLGVQEHTGQLKATGIPSLPALSQSCEVKVWTGPHTPGGSGGGSFLPLQLLQVPAPFGLWPRHCGRPLCTRPLPAALCSPRSLIRHLSWGLGTTLIKKDLTAGSSPELHAQRPFFQARPHSELQVDVPLRDSTQPRNPGLFRPSQGAAQQQCPHPLSLPCPFDCHNPSLPTPSGQPRLPHAHPEVWSGSSASGCTRSRPEPISGQDASTVCRSQPLPDGHPGPMPSRPPSPHPGPLPASAFAQQWFSSSSSLSHAGQACC